MKSQAYRVMMTAHQKGACVIAVFTKDVADTKAKEATELGSSMAFRFILPPSRKSSAAAARGAACTNFSQIRGSSVA